MILDLQHHLFGLTLGGGNLYTAPLDISKVHRVLDIGTGTGIWAMDFGTYCYIVHTDWKLIKIFSGRASRSRSMDIIFLIF